MIVSYAEARPHRSWFSMPILVPLECVVAIAADGSEIVDLITVGIAVAVVLAHASCPSNVLCPLPSAPCMLCLAKACRSAAATRRRCGRMSTSSTRKR